MRSRISATTLVLTGLFLPVPAAMANLVTGFEAPTYTPGSIAGQQGWTRNAADSPFDAFNIGTTNPKTGSQALNVPDTNVGIYAPELISPNTGTKTAGTTTSFAVDISGVTPGPFTPPPFTTFGARHDVYLVSDAATDVDSKYGFSNGQYVGGISFQSNGNVLVEAYDATNGGLGPGMSLRQPSAAWVWTPNTYHTFSISVDPTTLALTYKYDSLTLATTAYYETAVGNLVLRMDNIYNANETFTMDDLSITAVPEPATMGSLGIACLLVTTRRRQPARTARP